MQCVPHGAILGVYLDATAGPECSNLSSYDCVSVCPWETITLQVVMVTNWLLDRIQSASCHHKVLHVSYHGYL